MRTSAWRCISVPGAVIDSGVPDSPTPPITCPCSTSTPSSMPSAITLRWQ